MANSNTITLHNEVRQRHFPTAYPKLLGMQGGIITDVKTWILAGVAVANLIAAQGEGAQAGTVIGYYRGGSGTGNEAVWLVSHDCRISYRFHDFQQNRFVFNSVPAGKYRVLGYESGARWSTPTQEFDVKPGTTVTVDVHVKPATCGDNDDPKSCWPRGGKPLTARVVDERGEPLAVATIVASVPRSGSIWPSTETTSGADGRFGYCVVSLGKVTISIRHPAYRTRRLRVNTDTIDYGESQLQVTLRKR